MAFFKSKLVALTTRLSLAAAAPGHSVVSTSILCSQGLSHNNSNSNVMSVSKRSFHCSAPVRGLIQEDCQHLLDIGFNSQGVNSYSDNGQIWIGEDGPNTFTFTNNADNGVSVTLIVWNNPPSDYSSSFMNVRHSQVSYSLNNEDSITISLANGVSGGFSAIYDRTTTLSQYGQVNNTWGEFTTGASATIDISREVNMNGNSFSAKVSTGCLTNMNTCVFVCKDNISTCGEASTYDLLSCDVSTNPFAALGDLHGQPEGGCQGWDNGGHVDVTLSG